MSTRTPVLLAASALVVVMTLLATGVAAATDAAAPDAVAAPIEAIEAHVAEGLRANRVPGGALAVVDGDGEVHLRGFGTTWRGGTSVTADTPFVIGSVTKSMTALAVLQLVEDGLVDLDDPLSRHLPGFVVRPDAWTEQVTVRRLLDQTSGLPPLAGAPATTWLRDLPIGATAELVNGTELVSEPGTAWAYSNANYVLLGALIEEVTDRPYADQLEQRVFGPLGMIRTTARFDEAQAMGPPTGHRYVFGVPVAHTTFREGLVPSGLVVSTARDLGRYLQALLLGGELDGRRVLSEAGVELLFQPSATATLGPWAKEPATSYGMGWFVGGTPFGPMPVVFHPGATPDFGAMAALVPSTSTALVLLVNVGPRVAVPGAAGDVDRIGAGAVSLLIGSEPEEGGTVADAYLVAAPTLALALLASSTFAIRRPSRKRSRVRHRAVLLAATMGSLGVLALPTLGLGWRQNWLWAPDLTAAAAFVGLALAIGAARRLPALRSPDIGEGNAPLVEPPVPLTTAR